MAAKRMLSLRVPGQLVERIDRLAAEEGIDRTEWCSQALARQALTASGLGQRCGWQGSGKPHRPQAVGEAGDKP